MTIDTQISGDKHMKILHVIPSMDPKTGGVCQAVRTMIKFATDQHHLHEVVCLDEKNSGVLESDTFNIHALGKGVTAWHYNNSLTPWLIKNLPIYDKVIVHGLWQYQSFAIVRALKELKDARPKLFVMPHGMLDPYFQRAKDRRLKAVRNLIFWQLVEQHLIRTVDGMLFTCEIERNLAQHTFRNFTPKAQYSVGLGVEEPPLYTEEINNEFDAAFPQLKDKPFLLFLSRIDPKKGVDLLIKAYLKLQSEGSNMPVLIIAGPGLDSPFGREMVTLAAENSSIQFVGMLTGNKKWGAFYRSEAFVLPSHQENFGISVVEALACGKPVIITNKINIYKEIDAGGAGIIIDDNQAGIIAALEKWGQLLPQEINDLRKNAVLSYRKYFSPFIAAKVFLAVLQII